VKGHADNRNQSIHKTLVHETGVYNDKVDENKKSNIKGKHNCVKCTDEPKFTPSDLVDALSNSKHFKVRLFDIIDEHDLRPSVIKNIISQNNGTFSMDGKYILLNPKILVCNKHTLNGCREENCHSLHLCGKYVYTKCKSKSCMLGHTLDTKHNNEILKYLYIDQLPFEDIMYLITSDQYSIPSDNNPDDRRPSEKNSNTLPRKHQKSPKDLLKICKDYNSDICRNKHCSSLHICEQRLQIKKGCTINNCQLNHDILEASCNELLSGAGISMNESPRDILIAVCEIIGLTNNDDTPADNSIKKNNRYSIDSRSSHDSKHNPSTKIGVIDRHSRSTTPVNTNNRNPQPRRRSNERYLRNSSPDDVSNRKTQQGRQRSNDRYNRALNSTDDAISRIANVIGSNFMQANQIPQQLTIWANYPHGDTQVSEICYYSVESKCRNEDIGCTRLHSINHFHWQISNKRKTWLNLHINQILELEKAFCSPNENNADLANIDLSQDEIYNNLFQLLGRDSWNADFSDMTVSNSNNTIHFMLRRLCSERIAGSEKDSNTFAWYFKDQNNKWIPYGKVDSLGKDFLKSQVDSNDIERTFRLNGFKGTMKFSNSMFQYLIDFDNMFQINMGTKVKREIRRRPRLDSKLQTKGFLKQIVQLWWGKGNSK
ncbi:unnamed protein product, partial [Meganyctiphanes norvegica]